MRPNQISRSAKSRCRFQACGPGCGGSNSPSRRGALLSKGRSSASVNGAHYGEPSNEAAERNNLEVSRWAGYGLFLGRGTVAKELGFEKAPRLGRSLQNRTNGMLRIEKWTARSGARSHFATKNLRRRFANDPGHAHQDGCHGDGDGRMAVQPIAAHPAFRQMHVISPRSISSQRFYGPPRRIWQNFSVSAFPPLATQHTLFPGKISGAARRAAMLNAPVGSTFKLTKAKSNRTASSICCSVTSTIPRKPVSQYGPVVLTSAQCSRSVSNGWRLGLKRQKTPGSQRPCGVVGQRGFSPVYLT